MVLGIRKTSRRAKRRKKGDGKRELNRKRRREKERCKDIAVCCVFEGKSRSTPRSIPSPIPPVQISKKCCHVELEIHLENRREQREKRPTGQVQK